MLTLLAILCQSLYYIVTNITTIFLQPSKVSDPFPIPNFRKHTQARLLSKQMTPDLGTMLLTYVERSSKKICLIA